MATLEIVENGLWIRLSAGEKWLAIHRDLFIPATSLRGAEVLGPKWWRQLGLRVPGTAIPGLAIYGTYIWAKTRDFAAWKRGQQVIRLNLSGNPYSHVYLGTGDAQALADQVNDALTAC
ncbi:MAG: hypothetical protein ACKOWJ_01150 [Micrococcales bacterium]